MRLKFFSHLFGFTLTQLFMAQAEGIGIAGRTECLFYEEGHGLGDGKTVLTDQRTAKCAGK